MFAVKNKKTGKYLKAFNGSFNKAEFYVRCAIAEEKLGGKEATREAESKNTMAVINKLSDVSWEEAVERMWCLKTPEGGQLYKTEGAVAASISQVGEYDWLEIVPVKVVEIKKRKKKDG